MKKILIVILIALSSTILVAKQNSKLNSLFKEIMNSRGLQRTRAINKLNKFKHREVVAKVKDYLSANNVENKEAAAEVSGIIKDKSYEKFIKKNLKNAEDFQLINSLIFSIGENKYHKSGKLLCKYVSNKKYYKATYFALIKLSDNSCYRKFNKILNNSKIDYKEKLPVLELITKTKNKKYLKSLRRLFKKTKNSTLKYSSAIALIVLKDKFALKYILNYLNKDLESGYLKLKAYKQLEKLLDENNKNTEKIFMNGIKDKDISVKLFSIATMVKKNKYHALTQEDINFIESYSKSSDPNIYVLYSNYERYLIKYNKNKPKKEIIKNDNELAQPE